MASSAYLHSEETMLSQGFIRLAEACQLVDRSDPYATSDLLRSDDSNSISTAIGLGGARAAVAAIGLETIAVLCACGIWQLWRIFR